MPKKMQKTLSQKRVQNRTEYILFMYFVTHPYLFIYLVSYVHFGGIDYNIQIIKEKCGKEKKMIFRNWPF